MSVATEIQRIQGAKADIKTAIEAKGVTVPLSTKIDGYASLINSISSGFPNWMKDGDTHLWIDITNEYQLEQQLRLRMIGTIDWGDGTTEAINVTSYTTKSHTYAAIGKYRIDLKPSSGTFYLGGAMTSYSIMGTLSGRGAITVALYQVEVGTKCITAISNYAFYYARGLRRVYIPKTIETMGTYAFAYCYSLNRVEFEDASTITSTGSNYLFYYCYAMVDNGDYAPPALESFSYTYRNCQSLAELIVPASLTTIGQYSISSLSGLKKLCCLPTTPPSISNSNGFTPPTTCVITVPFGTLSAYQTASVWSDYSAQMVEAGTITKTLTNVTSSNNEQMVEANSSYTTTLIPKDGYTLGTVTVTMGGTDITDTVYSNGEINIANVTGNVIINASANS